MNTLMIQLQTRAEVAYAAYVERMKRTESLGWEAKIASFEFGEAELRSHTSAAELLGRHRAFADALALARQFFDESDEELGCVDLEDRLDAALGRATPTVPVAPEAK